MYAHAIRGRLRWSTGLCSSPHKLAGGELLASFPPPPPERLGPTRRFAYFPLQISCRLETPQPGSFRRLIILIKKQIYINIILYLYYIIILYYIILGAHGPIKSPM